MSVEITNRKIMNSDLEEEELKRNIRFKSEGSWDVRARQDMMVHASTSYLSFLSCFVSPRRIRSPGKQRYWITKSNRFCEVATILCQTYVDQLQIDPVGIGRQSSRSHSRKAMCVQSVRCSNLPVRMIPVMTAT